MDAHYDSQIKSVVAHTNYSGPARQMGSGGGLGAFAVRMGRVAIPLVRKKIRFACSKTSWQKLA